MREKLGYTKPTNKVKHKDINTNMSGCVIKYGVVCVCVYFGFSSIYPFKQLW